MDPVDRRIHDRCMRVAGLRLAFVESARAVRTALATLWLLVASIAFTASAADSSLPDWYLRELAQLTQGTGRWVADNGEYKSNEEPYEAYGVDWTMAPDKRGMTGRLFGLQGGKRVAEFWHFRIYSDAKERQAIVQQFADFGVIGQGAFSGFDRATLMDQTFTAPDGMQWRELHHAWFEGSTHVTRSFEWRDGAWVAKRTYRWSLDP